MDNLSKSNYQIHKLVATGGTAVLYRAVQTSLDRVVAIKKLHQHLTEDENFTRRFVLEAKAAASLDHENIVKIIDFGSEDATYYMVMEFIEGESLREILDKWKQLPVETALALVHQVCCGLEHAHAKGIVHRDIKPGNIMLTQTGRAKITDFGLAKLAESNTQHTAANSILGTPLYMSPEQAFGESVDHRSDLFSLGTMLYEMVTGVQPFRDENYMGVIQNIINRNAPHPSKFDVEVPQGVQNLLSKAMNKSRDARFQNAGEFRKAIEKTMGLSQLKQASDHLTVLLKTEGETMVLPKTQKHIQKKSRLRKGLAATLVAVTLLGAAGGAYTLAPEAFNDHAMTMVDWVKERAASVPQLQSSNVVDSTQQSPTMLTSEMTDSIVTRILAHMDSTQTEPDPAGEPAQETKPVNPRPVPQGTPSQRVSQAQNVEAPPKETKPEETKPKPKPVRKGWLVVSTDKNSEVYVDGMYRGDSPPAVRIELTAGRHKLECRSSNHEPYTETLNITAGEMSRRSVTLIEMMGKVSLTTTDGAEVYVDGSFKGTTPLAKPLEIPVGRHKLTIKKLGFNTWDNEIVVDANRTLPLNVILSPSY